MLATKNRILVAFGVLASLAALWGCRVSPDRPLIEGGRLIKEGRYQEAAAKLREATRLMPTNAQALNHLGLAYHGAGQLDQAERAYRQSLGVDRKLAAAHYNLGCLYLEQDKLQAALDELTSYAFLEPRSLQGKLKLARAQRRLGQLAEADKIYQEVLRAQPNNPDALNGLGLLEVARRSPLDANYYFRRVLDHNAQHPMALLNLAVLTHQHLNNPELAKGFYREYLRLNPRPINATEVERTLVALDPPSAGPVVVQAAPGSGTNAARNPPRQDSAAQATAPTRYKYRNPSKPRAGNRTVAEPFFRAGVTAQGGGRLADAVAAYRRAVQADPAYFEAYYNWGLAAYQLEAWADALPAYELALALRPTAADARYNFALALKRAEHHSEAVEQLQRLVRDHPKEARSHLALANLHWQQLADIPAARANYQKFLELAPNHPEASRVRQWLASH